MKFDFAFDKYLAQLMPKGLALVTFFIIKLLVKSKVKIGNDGDDCGDIGDDDVADGSCHFFSLQASCTVKSKDGQRMWQGGCRRPEDLHIHTCLKIVQVAFSAATDVESESEEKRKRPMKKDPE